MKPVRLEVKGFTSFRRPTAVDFTGRSLFAITGPTGAGKSSLLDAMTWALFGQVPRVGRATRQLVTHGEKSMAVRFEFEARGRRYRVARSTSGTHGARMEQRSDDGAGWVLVADRAAEVARQVGELLGLDYQTFTKTIVLPQGEFASFLRGEDRERREILSTLLGLDAYAAAGRAARLRARAARETGTILAQQIERLPLATPEALAALEAQRVALEAQAAAADELRERLSSLGELAEAHLAARREEQAAQAALVAAERAREQASGALAEAEHRCREAEADRGRVAAERAALPYEPAEHERLREAVRLVEFREHTRRAVEEARAALEAAQRTHVETEAALHGAESEAVATGQAAAKDVAGLVSASGALAGSTAAARSVLERLAEETSALERAASDAERAAAEHTRRAEAIAPLAARLAALDEEEAAQRATLDAATGHRDLALEAARTAHDATGAAEGQLAAARAHLDVARLEQAAAALRGALQPGDPCPVCGDTITQLPLHDAPDLDAAAAAVLLADAAVRAARAGQEIAARAAAGATARLAELESGLERLAHRRAELARELVDAGAGSPDLEALRAQVEGARTGTSAALAEVEASRAQARALEGVRRALEGLSARAAAVLEPAHDEAAAPPRARAQRSLVEAAERAGADLEVALTAHGTALEAGRRAEERARQAAEAARAAAAAARHAAREQQTRAQALAAAEQQLASIASSADGAGLPDADQLRVALAASEAGARKAAALDARLQQLATALAVLAQQTTDRRAVLALARAASEEQRGIREAAGLAATTAQHTFAARWLEVIGPEPAAGAASLGALREQLEVRSREAARELGSVAAGLEQARHQAAEAARLREEIDKLERAAHIAGALEQDLHADRFIAYVQREALAVLAADASTRLLHLSGSRYRLVTEGSEFAVIDQLNGDERRSVRTLSGGETFLASLALALALSERLPELAGTGGAVSLESLFLDEGFGSLDTESLDIAIEGLERLAGGRRLIGVISHVPEIAERLPDRIEVLKSPETSRIAAGRLPIPPERVADLVER